MSKLREFEQALPEDKSIRGQLLESLKETFLLWIEEFSRTLSRTFHTSKNTTDKHQIDQQLVSYEKELADERFDLWQ